MHEFSKPNPTIAEFREKFEEYAREISVDGELVNSHQLNCAVEIECDDSTLDYELVGMDIGMVPGCGCWSEIRLVIRKREE